MRRRGALLIVAAGYHGEMSGPARKGRVLVMSFVLATLGCGQGGDGPPDGSMATAGRGGSNAGGGKGGNDAGTADGGNGGNAKSGLPIVPAEIYQ